MFTFLTLDFPMAPFLIARISRILKRANENAQSEPLCEPKPSPPLPPELLNEIINNLLFYNYDRTALIDVVACSLVCKGWHHVARVFLGGFMNQHLDFPYWYNLAIVQRISDLIAFSLTLCPLYRINITSFSIDLALFVLTNNSLNRPRPTADDVFHLFTLLPNLHTLTLNIWIPSYSPSLLHAPLRELDHFLLYLRSICTKLTTLSIRSPRWVYLSDLGPGYARLVTSFAPTMHTLEFERTDRIHESLPTPTRLKHFYCHVILDRYPVLPFASMPDPIHCSMKGGIPGAYSFTFGEADPPLRLRPAGKGRFATIKIEWCHIRCRRLKTLFVAGCSLNDVFLLELPRKAPELERLALRDSYLPVISNDARLRGWEDVQWLSMRVLDLEMCRVDTRLLGIFVDLCPNLEEIKITEDSRNEGCDMVLLEAGFIRSRGERLAMIWRK